MTTWIHVISIVKSSTFTQPVHITWLSGSISQGMDAVIYIPAPCYTTGGHEVNQLATDKGILTLRSQASLIKRPTHILMAFMNECREKLTAINQTSNTMRIYPRGHLHMTSWLLVPYWAWRSTQSYKSLSIELFSSLLSWVVFLLHEKDMTA